MPEHSKFPFHRLPKDIIEKEIGQYLNLSNIAHLAQTSQNNQTLFESQLYNVSILLFHAVRRKDNAVQSILTKDINLLLKRGNVTDYSGRTFEDISAFEYMLWALDKHGWTIMLECIPKDSNFEKIFKELLSQYNKVETDGVTYTLNEKKVTEHHFDFQNTIIKALQDQVNSINAPNPNWEAINKQWTVRVGGAQKLLPLHVVHEYCADRPFVPVPDFNIKPNSSLKFYNWITDFMDHWFLSYFKLGSAFAAYKGMGNIATSSSQSVTGTAALDLTAMTSLCDVRTRDFIALKSTLENPLMAFDNQFLDNKIARIIY
ncbi:F-box protein [Legionella sp. PATHC032]|uniref:F-box protein n=1 Tax=Legionella sp. PATHC032 TaxID=2992039 RepID=UPI001B0B3A29|nr:F-box protein [Legionella sp. PATHC032]MCW8420385.1 F-box protein [Legionella sp. PATHC032]HAZ7572088.1 F-box protein [Legionella pneumophila]HBA1635230.1 F-box protein [Legionella pneumophila]